MKRDKTLNTKVDMTFSTFVAYPILLCLNQPTLLTFSFKFKIEKCMTLITRIARRLSIVFNQIRIGCLTEITLFVMIEKLYSIRLYIKVVQNVK
jgi:hypothetical protein